MSTKLHFYVFKTNIKSVKRAETFLKLLDHYFKIKSSDYSLEKAGALLTIESNSLQIQEVENVFNGFGVRCREVEN